MNFIDRWNATQMSYLEPLQPRGSDQADLRAAAAAIRKAVDPLGILTEPLRDAAEAQARAARAELYRLAKKAVMIDGALKPAAPAERGGAPTGVAVRVLRSAPRKLLAQEARASGKKTAPGEAQHEIQTQMELLIRHASYFVYIETQFFQSAFGEPSIEAFGDQGQRLWSGPMQYVMRDRGNRILAHAMGIGGNDQLLPHNPIAQALAERIAQAVRRDRQFHVYLVLPVHPEGRLDDIAILGQIHWTMQSLVFADRSLVNRVRRAIAARPLCKNIYSDAEWEAALRKAGEPAADGRPRYESVSEADWSKYLTLLNLRTCEVVGGAVRTEQVYVHSKLLIVDDMHVVVGSANINDRSLNGGRDSELAVMLMDTNKERKPMRDAVIHVNPLARKLRVDLWKKHLALAGGGNGIVQPAKELEKLIEWPAAAQTVRAIQKLAEDNLDEYHKIFSFVPWSDAEKRRGASIWPVHHGLNVDQIANKRKDAKEGKSDASAFMPFDTEFWQPSTKTPTGIKGYFTRLPTYWTSGENNHPDPISAMLLTRNGGTETNLG
jgi:phospholipase D1/2